MGKEAEGTYRILAADAHAKSGYYNRRFEYPTTSSVMSRKKPIAYELSKSGTMSSSNGKMMSSYSKGSFNPKKHKEKDFKRSFKRASMTDQLG